MVGSAKINPQFDDNDLHTISRTLGRPKERISRWLTDAGGSISYFLSISESGTWEKVPVSSGSSFLNVDRVYKGKDGKTYMKVLRSGCGTLCQKKLGIQDVDCPSCGKFTWHLPCLQDACNKRGMEMPDMSSDMWKCPQCRQLWK